MKVEHLESSSSGRETGADGAVRLRVLLVDPSLFTGPYDAALQEGLTSAGVTAAWAVRRLRPCEDVDLPRGATIQLFYPITERGQRNGAGRFRIIKGLEHALGLLRLVNLARAFDVIHFQWSMIPLLDVLAVRILRRRAPVVLTMHDTQAFNGKSMSRWRMRGSSRLHRSVDHLIVHTAEAAADLINGGADARRVSVVPHGPLALDAVETRLSVRDPRWRILLFGRMQTYKGLHILVEAVGLLDEDVRARVEVVIAGEPMMDILVLRARISVLDISDTLRIEARYFSRLEMNEIIFSADSFVFPYLAIQASGVLHLVLNAKRWIVASDLGSFRDIIGAGSEVGELVPPGDAQALADAITRSIGRYPCSAPLVSDWSTIGRRTRDVYEDTLAARNAGNQTRDNSTL